MNDAAIIVDNIGKEYRIGKIVERYRTLRDVLADTFVAPFRRAGKVLRGQAAAATSSEESIWALKDISFEIKRGKAVGIVGRNGAGKSTLLKVLSRITEPTTGYAQIRGRVGSLLEVGTGFHNELTGRENTYLNGAILGMRRSEIDAKFDEIVSFAEVEKFIDTPVKHYSSGMRLRLGFAVAAHLEPEILLIDEVLAVGDASFQRKCLGKMGDVTSEGRTVLFVSHNMGAITQLCEQAIWLEGGQVEQSGPSTDVVAAYLSSGVEEQDAVWFRKSSEATDAPAQLQSVRVLSLDNQPTAIVDFDTPFKVEITYDVRDPVRDLSITYHLFDSEGNLVFESMDTDLPEWKGRTREVGRYLAVCQIPGCFLKPGRYYTSVHSFIEHVRIIERQERVLSFDVSEVGYTLNPGRRGVVSPVLHWQVGQTNGAKPS